MLLMPLFDAAMPLRHAMLMAMMRYATLILMRALLHTLLSHYSAGHV